MRQNPRAERFTPGRWVSQRPWTELVPLAAESRVNGKAQTPYSYPVSGLVSSLNMSSFSRETEGVRCSYLKLGSFYRVNVRFNSSPQTSCLGTDVSSTCFATESPNIKAFCGERPAEPAELMGGVGADRFCGFDPKTPWLWVMMALGAHRT